MGCLGSQRVPTNGATLTLHAPRSFGLWIWIARTDTLCRRTSSTELSIALSAFAIALWQLRLQQAQMRDQARVNGLTDVISQVQNGIELRKPSIHGLKSGNRDDTKHASEVDEDFVPCSWLVLGQVGRRQGARTHLSLEADELHSAPTVVGTCPRISPHLYGRPQTDAPAPTRVRVDCALCDLTQRTRLGDRRPPAVRRQAHEVQDTR